MENETEACCPFLLILPPFLRHSIGNFVDMGQHTLETSIECNRVNDRHCRRARSLVSHCHRHSQAQSPRSLQIKFESTSLERRNSVGRSVNVRGSELYERFPCREIRYAELQYMEILLNYCVSLCTRPKRPRKQH